MSPPPALPPVQTPTLGILGTDDLYLTEEDMVRCAQTVAGPWRHERIEGAGHWVSVEAPDRLNRLLLDFLRDFQS